MDKKIIIGYPNYLIDIYGNVYNTKSGKVKTHKINWKGYHYLHLCHPENSHKRKQFYIHRLVALTFIPNPKDKGYVNHKDGNKNNNKKDNLQWATSSENQLHSYRELNRRSSGGNPIKVKRVKGKKEEPFKSIKYASKITGYGIDKINRLINRLEKDLEGFLWYKI